MKMIAEIVYGAHRASWHYNVAKFQGKDYLVLGVVGVESPGGAVLGFEIDRSHIQPRPCGYPRYGAPLEPARMDAVEIPAAALRPVRVRLAGDPGGGGPYFLVGRGGALYLMLNERDISGNLRGCLLDRGKISPASENSATHVYTEPLDLGSQTWETFPPNAMLDRLTLLDLEAVAG